MTSPIYRGSGTAQPSPAPPSKGLLSDARAFLFGGAPHYKTRPTLDDAAPTDDEVIEVASPELHGKGETTPTAAVAVEVPIPKGARRFVALLTPPYGGISAVPRGTAQTGESGVAAKIVAVPLGFAEQCWSAALTAEQKKAGAVTLHVVWTTAPNVKSAPAGSSGVGVCVFWQ